MAKLNMWSVQKKSKRITLVEILKIIMGWLTYTPSCRGWHSWALWWVGRGAGHTPSQGSLWSLAIRVVADYPLFSGFLSNTENQFRL